MMQTTETEFLPTVVGLEDVKRRLQRIAYAAEQQADKSAAEFPLAFLGEKSVGKTMVARAFSKHLGLPFVEIQPQSVANCSEVWREIADGLDGQWIEDESNERHPYRLIEKNRLYDADQDQYVLPACVVFIDEVHLLARRCVQGLLKAVERTDCEMVTEDGDRIDTRRVCWMIATTERGDLFDAFDSRFIKLHLRLYSTEEIAEIVRLQNRDLPHPVCLEIAKYGGRVPREALAFAREVRQERAMSGIEWSDACRVVAEDCGIDEFGLTRQRLDVLKALRFGPISQTRLPSICQSKKAEMVRFVLPPLVAITPDQPEPLVMVSNKGYTITRAGLAELQRRNIEFDVNKAIPRHLRNR